MNRANRLFDPLKHATLDDIDKFINSNIVVVGGFCHPLSPQRVKTLVFNIKNNEYRVMADHKEVDAGQDVEALLESYNYL